MTRRVSSFLHPLMEGLDEKKWERKIYNSSGGSIHSRDINQREKSALFFKNIYVPPTPDELSWTKHSNNKMRSSVLN